jgi:phenylacetate-coenzyme A ligase PaaK-like adenylate-forming protein
VRAGNVNASQPELPFTLPDLLRQPQEKVRALQDRLLQETIELCYKYHPFYRALMALERLEPRHIQNCDELRRLPVTTKKDFLSDPEAFRLRGDDLPLEAQVLWKVIYTTGTTSGKPAPIYVPAFDNFAYLFACARRQELVDIRPTDILANLFPLTSFPMGAYSRSADEVAAAGAAIVFAHTGRAAGGFPVHHSLDEAVDLIQRHRATILWGVAGYVRRVLVRARELGADFRSVRMAMITGEASSPAMRNDMRRRMAELGCADTRLVNRYGSTEQGGSMVECQEGSGFHSLAPDQVFHEVVENENGRRLPAGETGMLCFTHIYRRGTVLLRYLVGDVVSMTTASCPHCGRTCPRISSEPVRSGDIVKIKGTLVNLQVLKDELDQFPDIEEYQIIVRALDPDDEFSMDDLVIRLAGPADRREKTAHAMIERTISLVHIRPRIEFADRDTIFDPLKESKPRRVIDSRNSPNK